MLNDALPPPLSDQRYQSLMQQLAGMVAAEEAKAVGEPVVVAPAVPAAPDPRLRARAIEEILAVMGKHELRVEDLG